MTQTASLYFDVSCTAIRAHDKNHMILGVRNAHAVPAAVIEAMVGWVDVVDQHCYEDGPPSNLEQIHNITGRPVMVGEFSFTAIDSNLPNTVGARRGNPYMTQRQRANQFQSFVSTLMEIPYAIGFHWWQYNDEPSLGRWPDGEDSNYGIVSLSDEPYTALVNQMTETNAAIP